MSRVYTIGQESINFHIHTYSMGNEPIKFLHTHLSLCTTSHSEFERNVDWSKSISADTTVSMKLTNLAAFLIVTIQVIIIMACHTSIY